MTAIHVFCGSYRSERRRAIDSLVCEHWGRALLLTPTRQLARRRIEHILLEHGLPGAWQEPVMTFQDFVERLLRSMGIQPRPLDDLERRLLLEQAVESLRRDGKLDSVGEAAETPGFVSHLLRVITQLKQAAVEPEVFQQRVEQRAHPSWLDPVVAAVYAAYQQSLLDAGAFDRVGLFWTADVVAQRQCPPALDTVEVLALDGFDDFTPSEFRLLRTLANHAGAIVFGLEYNHADPSQSDLYRIPMQTLATIQKRFDPVQVRHFDEPTPTTCSEFVASTLFWRQPPTAVTELRPNVKLDSWPGVLAEVEAIGRHVKSLIVDDGASLDEILIVYRDLRDVAGAFRTVFGEFGIPLKMSRAPSLASSAVCVFLMNMLEAVNTWERETVVDVVTSPWFRPAEENAHGEQPALHAIGLIARLAHIVDGYKEWITRLEHVRNRLAEGLDEDDPLLRLPEPAACVDAALARLAVLKRLDELLPPRATPATFINGIEQALSLAGVAEALKRGKAVSEPLRRYETEAFRALRGLLGRLASWHEASCLPAPVTRAEFVSDLRRALDETEVPLDEKGVLCLDAEQARHVQFDYVFFGGVNEGSVPKPPASSAIYSEQDVLDLQNAQVPLESKHTSALREMLLFRHVVASARKQLWLSWHTLSREGGAQKPSPFVGDVREILALAHPATSDDAIASKSTDFVPRPEHAASWRDLRNAAFTPPGSPLRDAFEKELSHLQHGAAIERRRQSSGGFDAYDGVLSDPSVVAGIAQDFGAAHQFSVNQLETYAECPFRFFMERILNVQSVEAPAAEFDPLVRGRILHETLERFHAQFRGQSIPDIEPDEAMNAMQCIVHEVFAQRAFRGLTAPASLVEIEKARMAVALERYLRIERERQEAEWKPEHFEVPFGRARGKPSGEPIAKQEPFALETPSGTVLFSGRIDRIDVAQQTARIVDYKTSIYTTRKDILAGVSLQLPVYALALESHLMPGTTCGEAFLVHVGRKDRFPGLMRGKKDGWDARKPAAIEGVARAVDGIREGHFSPTPHSTGSCSHCAARGVCRFEPARIERKQEDPDEADA